MTYQTKTILNPKPATRAPNPMWILALQDLKQETPPCRYRVTPTSGEAFMVTLKGRKKQVVDTLIMREVFCASTVRVGDTVFRLKEDHNLHAETKALSNGRKYYTLNGTVELLGTVVQSSDGGAA